MIDVAEACCLALEHAGEADGQAFNVGSGRNYTVLEVAKRLAEALDCVDIEPEWLKGVKTIALTAGASAPEHLVEETVSFLRDKGFANVQELEVMPENVRFGLPPEIVGAIAAAPATL